MRKLIMTALACLSVVVVAAAPSLAGNNNGHAKKATGDVWFTNNYGGSIGQVPAHWVFNAHEGTPAKGDVFYQDQFGSYTADVTSVTVLDAQNAKFSAKVTSTSNPSAPLGTVFTWTVHDRGEPGTSDYFTYWASPTNPIDLPAITAGNIQVHV